MTGIHLELLDSGRRQVFSQLKCLQRYRGTLAGGTALSLQIKHRYSLDFDIFFDKHVVGKAFKAASRTLEIKEKRLDRPGHITFLTKQGVQVTLFYYEFFPLYPRVKTDSLPLFNLRDLATDKAYTLGRRPIWRDYVDLFFLLKEEFVTLESLIKDGKRKFKAGFAPKLFLEQLTYYGDIREFKIEFIDKEYSPQEIQEFLKKEVLGYTKTQL